MGDSRCDCEAVQGLSPVNHHSKLAGLLGTQSTLILLQTFLQRIAQNPVSWLFCTGSTPAVLLPKQCVGRDFYREILVIQIILFCKQYARLSKGCEILHLLSPLTFLFYQYEPLGSPPPCSKPLCLLPAFTLRSFSPRPITQSKSQHHRRWDRHSNLAVTARGEMWHSG